MQNQHSYHATATASGKQRPAEVLFIDGDQWNPRALAPQVIMQLACNMHHYTTPRAACSTLSHTVRIHADNYMQSNAARLTVRTPRLVPISIPLWTPVVSFASFVPDASFASFSPGMRQKQPETQRQNSERHANTLHNMRHTRI